jgi:hypothetical protein
LKFPELIPGVLIETLPRRVSNWSDLNRQHVAEAVWVSSYGQEFEDTLRQHIQANIPQLLLPHLIKEFIDVASEAFATADQIVHANVNATEAQYAQACDRLNRIDTELQDLRLNSRVQLLDAVTINEDIDAIEQLTDMAGQLQATYDLPRDSLVPLYDWSSQLGQTIDSILTSIYNSILERQISPQGILIDSLPPSQREKLEQVIAELQQSGYQTYAIDGGFFEAKTDAEKNKLAAMNHALNSLADVLAANVKFVLDHAAEREAERVQDALQVLLQGYSDKIGTEAQAVASDLAGFSLPPSTLARVQQKLLLSFQLIAAFPVNRTTRNEAVGTKPVWIGEERVWWKLWLGKRQLYRYDTIYEKRVDERAVIPSLTDVFSGFIEQAKASRHETEFVRWMQDQIKAFLNDIEQFQEKLLKEYRTRLDQAVQHASFEKEREICKWQHVSDQIMTLRTELLELTKVS